MITFPQLLRRNRNYRNAWIGQVVSEVGDHFNTIAVFSLVLETTGSGLVVSGIMLSRAVPMVMAGPVAGVVLDRMDRKLVMIASDLFRALAAVGFILALGRDDTWLLYLFSGLLMFASPFFLAGRSAILPTIANDEELHTANALTQTTKFANVAIGTLLGGLSAAQFGYKWAFLINAASFLFSAFMISRLRVEKGGFKAPKKSLTETDVVQPWREYRDGLRYLRATPLMLGIAMLKVGWASGGGAAQILFSLFGEVVFRRGAAGIGIIWSAAGVGLLVGAAVAHRIGQRLSYEDYKKVIAVSYAVHGASYILFSQAQPFWLALAFIALSRAASAVSVVLNQGQLLRHVDNEYRGRVFSTLESITWATMMISLTAAGVASETYSPRTIGAWAGLFSSFTAVGWAWANWTKRLPEPALQGIDPDDMEIRTQPRM